MKASLSTISDRINALYACAEMGYEDPEVLLEASKLLIVLTSYDPGAFTDDEILYIQTQMRDAEFYANRRFNTRNTNNEGH